MTRPLLLVLLPFLASCQGSEAGPPLVVRSDSAGIEIVEAMRPLWGDSSLWRLDPDPLVDLTLSGDGPRHEFHGLRDMKQRPDGSLVIADGSSQEVRVFSAAGEFLGSFGGSGDGPGEFRSLRRIENAGDTLLALDRGRVTVATHDLTVVGTFNIDPWTIDLHDLGGGRILPEVSRPVLPMDGLAGPVRPPQPLVLLDLEGTRIDSVGELRGAEVHVLVRDGSYVGTAPHFFGKQSHVTALGGHILRGSSDAMQLEELDLSGNIVRILRIPDYPLDLSEALIAAERDFLLDGFTPGHPLKAPFEAAPVSDTRPAFTDIHVDPSGAVWLELHRGETERDQPEKWLVLDADGTWLGTVEMPDGFRVADIAMDAVLGVREDALDIQHPQLLRLTRN
ncbi:MAG: hypothetical protein OXN85_14265 [Gemmatimonadetes bacterium]|nr:hypothetical protein [Candidatus Palauibacter australiensis]